jgi:hypothetical protein
MSREHPFQLAFGPLADRFGRIRESLDGTDSGDRDRFLLNPEVAALLLELRPEEGYGAATEAMAALVHHGYLFWGAGERVLSVSPDQLARALEPSGVRPRPDPAGRPPCYVQLPSFAVWGILEGGAPEPLDGWFAARADSTLLALAVFGVRSGREGFTTLEVGGGYPGLERREDGAPLFTPLESESGTRTGMGAVASEAELLELAWRIEPPG